MIQMIRMIIGLGVGWIMVAILLAVGWVMNIVALVGMASAPVTEITLMFILRVVGIFAWPLGGVFGYL